MRGLYAITPEALAGERLAELVHAALEGGAAVVQYRSKLADPAQHLRDAKSLRALCRARGVPFIVNDDPRLALEADADGVHLGREDGSLAAARALLGARIVGVSCYDDFGLAQAAVAAGADYVAFGSVFPSPTKPAAVRAPLELFRRARRLGVPLVAIGGITLANATQARGAGADCVAVISDLFSAADVAARARAYAALFTNRTINA
jgi:thiamine-phosphate pyrophosphorylase